MSGAPNLATISIWTREKRRVHLSEKKTSIETVLVSDEAPGLYVKDGHWVNFDRDANKAQLSPIYGAKVYIASTGRYLTTHYKSVNRACALAVGLASIFDWTTCEFGKPISVDDETAARYEALLKQADDAERAEYPTTDGAS